MTMVAVKTRRDAKRRMDGRGEMRRESVWRWSDKSKELLTDQMQGV